MFAKRGAIRFATYLAPNMYRVYQCVADYAGRQLGYRTELVVGESFAAFASGEVDVGFICGLPYVQLTRNSPAPIELLAAPVLQGERYHDQPIYFSDVIVRRDSPYHVFADLRGCRWAYNDPNSHSGYNVTRYTLVRLGETRGFFGRVVEAGFHQEALRMVADGRVDASAIDSQVLAVELRDHPDLAGRVRIIDTLGPATIQPVAAARHVSATLKDDLRAVLCAIGDDPASRDALDYGFVARFIPIADTDYDDIRMMVSVAEEAGFLELR
ncbi:MAG TPA: PhnD/SsuA/transferrin family substrate-binding protein [Ktedonobacterales bacterium]|nr:PhnD/SsuA/transferrin family substrate-binding protein [Ktedonobacterales bacterium]